MINPNSNSSAACVLGKKPWVFTPAAKLSVKPLNPIGRAHSFLYPQRYRIQIYNTTDSVFNDPSRHWWENIPSRRPTISENRALGKRRTPQQWRKTTPMRRPFAPLK
jgi:hypothetical protein